MALYVPAGRRRRNLVLGLVAALVVGLVLGGLIGRASAPSLSDQVTSAQNAAREVTARVRSTPIEYAKQLGGSNEFQNGGTVAQALADAKHSLTTALDDAEWLGTSQRKDIEAALAGLVTAVRDKVAADRYEQLADAAATRIDAGFGIDAG